MDNKTELEQIMYAFVSQRNESWGRQMKTNPGLKLSLDQMTDTFFFEKLAEFELRLRKIEERNKFDDALLF